MPAKQSPAKYDWLGFPGAFTAVIVLAGLAVAAVVAWPVMVFHGSARAIGEFIWVGVWVVPILILLIATALNPEHRARKRLEKLRNERLRAEGRHPSQLAARKMQEEALATRRELARQQAERHAARAGGQAAS